MSPTVSFMPLGSCTTSLSGRAMTDGKCEPLRKITFGVAVVFEKLDVEALRGFDCERRMASATATILCAGTFAPFPNSIWVPGAIARTLVSVVCAFRRTGAVEGVFAALACGMPETRLIHSAPWIARVLAGDAFMRFLRLTANRSASRTGREKKSGEAG